MAKDKLGISETSEISVCNPVWPCAMTGACSILGGIEGLTVVIHGSSGCYFYPQSLLKVPLFSSFLLESEIVLGSSRRLCEVVSQFGGSGPVAVLNTCVPSLTGENLTSALPEGTIFVDAPGFCGNLEVGMKKAYEALDISVSGREGVNIDGLSLFDLFWRGNLSEAKRILSEMNIATALTLAHDSYENIRRGAGDYSVSVNPGFGSGIGKSLGSFLFPELCGTVEKLCDVFPKASGDAVLKEWHEVDEQIYHYADKFLRKFNPPRVFVCGPDSYCEFSKKMTERYFGSEVCSMPRSVCSDAEVISRELRNFEPDLIIGSSFEANVCPGAAFFGLTLPDRSRISFAARALSGLQGGAVFAEGVLNAIMDKTRVSDNQNG